MQQQWNAWCALISLLNSVRSGKSAVAAEELDPCIRVAQQSMCTLLKRRLAAQAGYLYLTNPQRLHALMAYLGLGGSSQKANGCLPDKNVS